MINFNELHATATVTRLREDRDATAAIIKAIGGMSDAGKLALFGSDFGLRAVHEYTRNKVAVEACAVHAAWTEFFRKYELYNLYEPREYENITREYVMSDAHNRRFYDGVKQLHDFTQDTAHAFFIAHIADTTARRKYVIGELLRNCGTDYRKSPILVSAKLTLRNVDAYSDTARKLGLFVRLAAWLTGVDFTWNCFYSQMRNNKVINGEQFEPCEGVPITLEHHQNGNGTLRIDRALVTQLNAVLNHAAIDTASNTTSEGSTQ